MARGGTTRSIKELVLSDAARAGLELRESSAGELLECGSHSTELGSSHRLDSSRLRQLVADLKLTPTERVIEAEQTLKLSDVLSDVASRDRVIMFDDYSDYLRWDATEGIDRR